MKNIDKNEKNKPTVDLSRRRLTKLGLVASPILTTLPGKPAMALYSKNNCTVSGNMSGNMSQNVDSDPCETTGYVGGHPPSFWAIADNWPSAYNKNADKFNDVFGSLTQTKSGNGGYSLLEVVKEEGNPTLPANLDVQAVAALLNAAEFVDYGYTPAEVLQLYADYANTGNMNDAYALMETFVYLNNKR